MAHLTDFVHWLNYEVGGEGKLPIDDGSFGKAMEDSIQRHYAEDRQKGGVRMSNLGKPAVLLALAKLGYAEPEPRGKMRYIFMNGDFFENWLEIMLKVYGIEILESQPEVSYMGVDGHADFIIKCPHCDKPLIVEAKTMSENYHRMFTKEPNDDRGYITQLAMYSHSTGYDSTWITLNKGTNEVTEIEPNPGILSASLQRASNVLGRLDRVKVLEDVLEQLRVPPGRPERFRNQQTGKLLMQPSIAYSKFATALYKLSQGINGYGKPTYYIDDIADTEHMKRELDFLVANKVLVKD